VPQVGLLAPAYLAKRGALIQVNHRLARVRPGNPLPYDTGGQQSQPDTFAPPEPPGGGHTTHFSVADQWGNVVSCTSTIEAVWGTGIMVPGYGFLLNNDLTDFNLTPQYDPARGNLGANDVAPLKRPKSSMTPTIVFLDGKPVAAYGSPGDTAIINTVLQITLNLFDHGMDLQPAIAAPRISVAAPDGFVRREAGFSATVLRQLQDMGHRLSAETSILGSVQAVAAGGPTGEFCGGADPRRQGTVIGVPGKNDKN
jgi:gamma-glutamyltranspeptidase/glutathione hydrolase